MLKFNTDILAGSSVSNKDIAKVHPKLYKTILEDFKQLKSFWSKAFFVYLLERSDREVLKNCGKKLHLDLKIAERMTYIRYMKHFFTDLKKAFVTSNYGDVEHNITQSLIDFGNMEFIILNKVIFNCTDEFKFKNLSVTKDMKKLIEKTY